MASGVVNTVKTVAGATLDPLNITGMGGIPGVNAGGNGLLGEFNGANAADRALAAQTAGANQAMGTVKTAYDDTKAHLQPWQDTGTTALNQLAGNNFMQGYQGSPAMQFQLDQAARATNAGMAARGLGNSGAALKALQDRAQGIAQQDYNQQRNFEFQRLNTLAGYGSTAAGNMADAATGYGANVAGIQTGLANANAAAQTAKGQGMQNMVGQGIGLAALISDQRLKTNITEVSKEDIAEFKKALKPFWFNYANESHGEGDWVGVMAQDLEKSKLGKSIVVEIDGKKTIDIKKAVSLMLAITAEAA